ncbi:MAG TPA: 30S ribosomal protein S7 [Anaerolineae bacterium]|mgnify:CR=1 FL=1|nr:30S ribosomal protein S7 [Anaerolineae bacterium]HMR64561.1 30S ribosomal protein S7 [Anaerolineae bacterium]
MARRNRAPVRYIEPDVKYNSTLVARFINKLMKSGKKTVAATIFYDALTIAEKRAGKPGIEVFEQAIKNVTPLIEVRPRRVGGATYQIPMEVRPERRRSLAIRWLVNTARGRSGKSMADKLAAEILDAFNNQGTTVKKREDTHRMAEANRAFAHYRW